MKMRTSSYLSLFLCTVSLGACSLINSFDDLKDVSSGSGGAGLGGDTGSGGAAPMGGDTGTGGMDSTPPAEPGLVVIVIDEDSSTATTNDQFAVALDPRTGDEYDRIAGDFDAIEHEAGRDVWYFVENGKIQARKFDRVARKFVDEGAEASAPAKLDVKFSFAVTERLFLRDDMSNMHVYDTSNLEKITELTPAIPIAFPSTDVIWGGTGVPSNNLKYFFLLRAKCDAAQKNCKATVSRFDPNKPVDPPVDLDLADLIVDGDLTISDEGINAKKGAIGYDPGSEQLVAYIPTYLSTATTGTLYRFGVQLSGASTPDKFVMNQNGPNVTQLAVDPCLQVAFAKDIGLNQLSVGGMTTAPDRQTVNVNVQLNGQGMKFEPYTGSLIMIQQSGPSQGVIAAYQSRGTTAVPQMMRRIADWSPSFTGVPTLVRVESPIAPICN